MLHNIVFGKEKYIVYIYNKSAGTFDYVYKVFFDRLKIQPLHGITVLFKLNTMQGHQNTIKLQKALVSTIEGGRDITNLSPFWGRTVHKKPLPETFFTNPLVK